MRNLTIGSEHGEEQLEKDFPDRVRVAGFGWGEERDELFYLPSDDVYLERGPFGHWNAWCYRVIKFEDKAAVQAWVEIRRTQWTDLEQSVRSLTPGATYQIHDVEALFPELEKVAQGGAGEMKAELWYLKSRGIYLEKGPEGKWNFPKYKVCDFNDAAGVKAWAEKHR